MPINGVKTVSPYIRIRTGEAATVVLKDGTSSSYIKDHTEVSIQLHALDDRWSPVYTLNRTHPAATLREPGAWRCVQTINGVMTGIDISDYLLVFKWIVTEDDVHICTEDRRSRFISESL